MNLDQAQVTISLLLGICALAGVVVGYLRWWRPKYRHVVGQVVAGRDSLIGREAVVDSITGREILPALPGIGVRMENVETAVVKVVDLIESEHRQNRRIEAIEAEVGQLWHRVGQLEDGVIERVAAKAESVATWRAVEKIAETGSLPDDAPELD